MKNQYCRVGAITPISNAHLALSLLEYQYQNFMEKASDIKYANSGLGDFFENKARQIKNIIENFVP